VTATVLRVRTWDVVMLAYFLGESILSLVFRSAR
jgi:hypothetical protein